MVIKRTALRDQVYDEITTRIFSGELAPGAAVSDVTLSADLDVSRTPVREALLRLAVQGIVNAEAGRGFTIKPLVESDITEGYPILWTLECLALRERRTYRERELARLDQLNDRMRQVVDKPARLIAADDAWHDALLAACPNRQLLGLIHSIKHRLRRYEFTYMRDAGRVIASTDQHAEIIRALRASDTELALIGLERNWSDCMRALLKWITTATAEPALNAC